MKRTLVSIVVALLFVGLNSLPTAFAASTVLEITQNELASAGTTQFSLSFIIGGAQITVARTNDTQTIVRAVVTYDDDDPEPTLTTTADSGKFTASFRSGYEIEDQWSSSLQEWEITIGNYDINTDLSMAYGGVMGDADLGGLPLRNVTFAFGGVDMDVDFSIPTTRQVEKIQVDCGGALVSMANIGNTDFEKFELNGGGNIIDLDFQGAYVGGQHDVSIVVAGSEQEIAFPSDAGERVEVVSIAAPIIVKGMGWEKERRLIFKTFTTDDYDSQNIIIDTDITAVGSLVIIDRE
jgi:hypothetical protein